jgi:RNA polymerase primary sigma factor
MAKTATAKSQRYDDEAATTGVDELIQRGRSQGHLSLPDLRAAFERAQISPTEARSIIRELTETGVQLGNDQPEAPVQAAATLPSTGARKARSRTPDRAAGAGEPEVTTAIADVIELDGIDASEAEASALVASAMADIAVEADLDDQTSVMGDSVHTYLKSIGRTSLLTAEQEVDLAKPIEAGLYAEHKL